MIKTDIKDFSYEAKGFSGDGTTGKGITPEQALEIAKKARLDVFYVTSHTKSLMTAGTHANFHRALNLAAAMVLEGASHANEECAGGLAAIANEYREAAK